MKKKSERKLSLGKIKIASLSKPFQQVIQGGSIACQPTIVGCPRQSNSKIPYAVCVTEICVIKP
jgi:hypothetical protein